MISLTVDPQMEPSLSPTPLVNKPSVHNFPKAVLLGIIIFLFLGLTAYGAYWYGQSLLITKSAPSTSATEKPSPFGNISNPTSTSDETANWKTYSSSKYNLSFKYPSLWTVDDSEDGVNVKTGNLKKILALLPAGGDYRNDKRVLSVHVQKFARPLKDLNLILSKFMTSDQLQDFRINDLTGKSAVLIDNILAEPPNFSLGYYFDHNGLRWTIDVPSSDERGNHLVIYDQILSAFKFF